MARLDTVLVVSHTHWDREWYHSAERFLQRLVPLTDELLDDPPSGGSSFLLDGQAVLLDDYLAVRPERAGELSRLLREGRLEAGPWYVLADELLPSAEALVRNLLAGRDTLRRLRAEPPPVLYAPDAFGHPAALPDLGAGFGCTMVVVWRGYGGARWPEGDVVRWQGAGGATVLLYHLPPAGYEFGSTLPVEPDAAASRWSAIEAVLAPRATSGAALLLNGADHHARQRDLGTALAALAAAATPVAVRAASLRAAAEHLAERTGGRELPVVQGELRDSYGYTWTLQGTAGTRTAQKREAARVERLLVREVEPWLALAHEGGGAAPRALLDATWRTLLLAHPHDTLCGTAIDAVARAFDDRIRRVRRAAFGLRADALARLLGHDVEGGDTARRVERPTVIVRNPVARRRGGIVELTLRARVAAVAVGPGSALRQGTRRALPPWRVEGVPLQLLDRREGVALTEAPRAYPRAHLVHEQRALGWVAPLDGYALRRFRQHASGVARSGRGAPGAAARGREARAGERPDATEPRPVRATRDVVDNGRLRVRVSSDGGIEVEDLERGRVVRDLLAFERTRDVGDLYTAAPREPLPTLELRRRRRTLRGPLRGELALDYVVPGARNRRSAPRCTLRLSLDAEAHWLRIAVAGWNGERDQRLRLRIATGLAESSTVADAAFHPVHRTLPLASPDEELMERVVPTAPLHRWVARFTCAGGMVLVSDGLAEYESAPLATLVTLVRSVGRLSRTDLPERPGHAGWPAEVPLAQSRGPFAATFGIQLVDADSPATRRAIECLADDVLLPLRGETWHVRADAAAAAGDAGGLTLLGDTLAFSAAMPARRAGWIVLRCVNRSEAAAEGVWRVGRPLQEAFTARLDETPLDALPVDGAELRFRAGPREIVTILAR